MHYNMLNEVMSCRASVMPTPGMFGTMFVGSDRYQVVCLKVLSPKRVLIAQHLRYDNPPKDVRDGIEYYAGDFEKFVADTIPTFSDKWVARYGDDAKKVFEWIEAEFYRENIFSLRRNGRWLQMGEPAHATGAIHWGVGDEYRDPCF